MGRVHHRRALLLYGLPVMLLAACTPAPIQDPGHQLVFLDTFETLDTTVWATAPYGGSLPATVSDGLLTLQSTAANNYHWGFLASTGPHAQGEPNFPRPHTWEEGYFEARIRYTNNPWSWPAFWLFSMAKSEAWPGEDCSRLTAEWDIMENGAQNGEGTRPASNWYFTTLHRNTTDHTADGYCGIPDGERQFAQEFPGVDLSDWHTWAGRWTADEVCTYLDNQLIQCTETYDSTAQPMHMVFTIQYLGQCAGCGERPPELELQVDWVRVWRRG